MRQIKEHITEAEARLLLDKFYDGRTDAAEELLLKDFFSAADACGGSTDMEADRRLFLAMTQAGQDVPEMPDDFRERMECHIDSLARRRSGARIIYWMSAAVAAAVAGILFLIPSIMSSGDINTDLTASVAVSDDDSGSTVEISSPEKALRITATSFRLIASGTSSAKAQLESMLGQSNLHNSESDEHRKL